jgi:hypothetical protein
MNFPWGRVQVPQRESHLPHGPMYFQRERLKFFKKIYVPNLFTIRTILYSFLYKLTTNHWKSFKENYNFIFRNVSIRTHLQKLWSYEVTIIVWSLIPHLTCCYCLVFTCEMEIVAYWTIVALKLCSITYNNFASKQANWVVWS